MSSNTIAQTYSFSPVNAVSGCSLWLDAADPTTIGLSGSNITTWTDKSGFGRNATSQGTGATYSNNGLVFTGTQTLLGSNATYLHNSVNGTWTVFSVFRATNTSIGNPRILNYQGTPNGVAQFLYIEGGRFNSYIWSSPPVQLVGSTVALNTSYLTSVVNTTSNTILYVNGSSNAAVSHGTNTTTSNSTYWIGGFDSGSDRFYGILNELIVFSNALTSSQQQQIEGYLAWKWNLVTNLPTSNPYKTAPPFANNPQFPPSLYPTQPISLGPSPSPFAFLDPLSASLGPTCILWIDAQDPFYSRTGGKISAINDKSGFGGALATSLGSNYYPTYNPTGLNGLPCFQTQTLDPGGRFYGTFGAAAQVSRSTYTVITILTPLGVQANSRFVSFIGSTGDDFSTGPGWSLYTGSSSSPYTLTPLRISATNSTPSRSVVTSNVTVIQTLTGTASSAGSLVTWGLGLATMYPNNGGGALWAMNIGEFLVYNGTMTQANYQRVEGYLAWKWSAQSSLPATHPFRNAPPGLPIASVPQVRQLSSGVFSPLQISGCSVWLDAADGSTVSLSGTAVTQWRDKSGNGKNATTNSSVGPNYTQNVLNTSPSLYFDGTNFMSFANNTLTGPNGIFFIVAKEDNGQSGQCLIMQNYLGLGVQEFQIDTTGMNLFYPPWQPTGSWTSRISSWSLLDAEIIKTTGRQNTYTNGSLSTAATITISASTGDTADGTNIGRYTVNGSESILLRYKGFIAEIIYYNNTILTTFQRQQIEGYLAWKWGLVANLPASHPYKKWPPLP